MSNGKSLGEFLISTYYYEALGLSPLFVDEPSEF